MSGLVWFAGTSGVLLRKVNGTAIIQLPSKQQVQVRLSGLRIHLSGKNRILLWTKCRHLDTHRCWRPAWSQWDACPTLTTTNRSLAKPVAIAGSAFALRAACGREREAGQDARLNRCLRWRATSTCPQSRLNNTTWAWTCSGLEIVVITLYYDDIKWTVLRGNVNKDEPFVQKIKNFIKHNCLWEHGKKQNNIKIQNIFTSIVKQHAE